MAGPTLHGFLHPFVSQNPQKQGTLNRLLVKKGWVGGGNAKRYISEDGENFIFVELETGPELIAYLALLTTSLNLAKSIVDLIVVVIKTISENNEKKKKGQDSGRHYEAKAIVIEKRTKKGSKTVKVIGLPVNVTEITEEGLLKLLK